MDYQLTQTGEQTQNLLDKVPTIETNLNAEILRSTNKDEELETAIGNEKTRAEGAEGALETAIGNEKTRAEGAELALAGDIEDNATAIGNEKTRAEGAEGTLQGNIDAEATTRENADDALQGGIDAINGKIPNAASQSNQLADKAFVNSSIATNTADFKGTYNSLEQLEQVSANANDYGFVVATDAAGNTVYNRYKYVAGTGWMFEYALNNSSFTSEQWAAIQSGITALLVAKLADLPTVAQLTTQLNQIIASVTAEKTRAENAEDALSASIAANTTAIGAEKTRAEGAEAVLREGIADNALAIAAEKTRAEGAEGTLQTAVNNEKTRAEGAELTLQQNINAEATLRDNADDTLQANIDAINAKIPSAASSSNQLADKAFVNSSISTNTADFKGTYNSLAELQAVTGANANDYGFVIATDAAGNTVYNRYKYVEGTGWVFEYALNNSSFTSEQWAAIQSGITALLVSKLSGLPDIDGLNAMFAAITSLIPSAATSSNKLVDYAQMVAALATKQNTLTFDNAPTAGSDNPVKSQGILAAINAAIAPLATQSDLNTLAGRVTTAEGRITTAEANITSLDGRISTAEDDIEVLRALYNALLQSAPQIIQPSDTWPVTNPSATVIYRVIDRVNTPPEYYSDYMWNGTAFVLMATYNNAVDTTPQKDSVNLVTSGGVFANIGAFDISEYNKSGSTLATYADLTAALAALPSDFQKGGMSIKFVHTSDNNYVQYRYLQVYANTTAGNVAFLNTDNWQGVDEYPIDDSKNLVEGGGVSKNIKEEVGVKAEKVYVTETGGNITIVGSFSQMRLYNNGTLFISIEDEDGALADGTSIVIKTYDRTYNTAVQTETRTYHKGEPMSILLTSDAFGVGIYGYQCCVKDGSINIVYASQIKGYIEKCLLSFKKDEEKINELEGRTSDIEDSVYSKSSRDYTTEVGGGITTSGTYAAINLYKDNILFVVIDDENDALIDGVDIIIKTYDASSNVVQNVTKTYHKGEPMTLPLTDDAVGVNLYGYHCCTKNDSIRIVYASQIAGYLEKFNLTSEKVDSLSSEMKTVEEVVFGKPINMGTSLSGYLTGGGLISSDNTFRHFEVPVEVGKAYYVLTRLGSGTTWIGEGDTSGMTSNIKGILRDQTNYNDFNYYRVVASKPYLYITFYTSQTVTPYTQCDYMCKVIEVDDFAKVNEEINGGDVFVGTSLAGYVQGGGVIANDNRFRHFEIPVIVGHVYDVYTKLGTGTVWIAGGDTTYQAANLIVYAKEPDDPTTFHHYKVYATKPYLYVSYYTDSTTSPYTEYDNLVKVKEFMPNDIQDIYIGDEFFANRKYTMRNLLDVLWVAAKLEGKKRIHIANGTYNILEALGGMDYINSKSTNTDDWTEVQPVMKNVEIIGYGNVVLNFNLSTTDYEHYWLFSCLNFCGNVKVENITINASNCRYAIHDECEALQESNTIHEYNNIRINSNARCIGSGTWNNTTVKYDKCRFNNTGNNEVWSVHAATGTNIIISDSIFIGDGSGNHTVRISQNFSTTKVVAMISNSYFNKNLLLKPEWGTDVGTNYTDVDILNMNIDVIDQYSSQSNTIVKVP